ncbi:MAG: hypothetical protein KC502_06385 [Myxococcales bacterium]|nr:hypothetical protein [Myxococcales bacterium]
MSKTKTQMTTQTQIDVEQGLATANLSALEERAVRMRYGLTLGLDAKLSFADEAHPEARLQVAEVERRIIAHLQTDTDARRKQAIIEELREI